MFSTYPINPLPEQPQTLHILDYRIGKIRFEFHAAVFGPYFTTPAGFFHSHTFASVLGYLFADHKR
jgi:hypothetical protein